MDEISEDFLKSSRPAGLGILLLKLKSWVDLSKWGKLSESVSSLLYEDILWFAWSFPWDVHLAKNTCSLWAFKKGSVDPWFNFIFSRALLCLSHTLHRFSSFVYLWFILHIFFWTIFQLIHSLCLQICLLCYFFHCHDNIKYYFL